jgi:hypothetical protein
LALIVAYPLRSGAFFAGFASAGAGAGEEDMTCAAGEWTAGAGGEKCDDARDAAPDFNDQISVWCN